MTKTIPNPEILEKNIDAHTRDFVKALNDTTVGSTAQEILHLKGEVEELRKQLNNLKDTIPTIFKGLVEEPMSDFKKKVTKGDVVRFMKKMGWSE